METVNNNKQQILQNVRMDTQTTFMNNGDINIYPCIWEQDKAPVTADGKGLVRYRAGVVVEEDGRTRMKRYRDGLNGPKYETLFQTAHGALKATRPWIRKTAVKGHKVGERRLDEEQVYVTFKFPKKYGRALIMSLYQEEGDEIMSYLKTMNVLSEREQSKYIFDLPSMKNVECNSKEETVW